MALKSCKDCGRDVSTAAKACPNCGRKVENAWTEIKAFLGFVFIGIPALVVGLAFCAGPTRPPAASHQLTRLENDGLVAEGPGSVVAACAVAQALTRESLKAPATAKFQTCGDTDVTFFHDGGFVVIVEVDAQNSFGALLRSRYRVEFGKKDGKLTVADFSELPR
jgi:RNA polymerase subunit RPABC4/transcription elongation factor Spt4